MEAAESQTSTSFETECVEGEKEAFDEGYEILMGCLQPYMDSEFIKNVFESLGVKVKEVKRLFKGEKDSTYRQPERFAFLKLADSSKLHHVLSYHSLPIPSCPNQHFVLRQTKGSPMQNQGYRLEYNVYVSELSWDTTTEQVYAFFKHRYPSVTEAFVCRGKSGNHRGFGFVRFMDVRDRDRCLLEISRVPGLGSRLVTAKPATKSVIIVRDTPETRIPPPPLPLGHMIQTPPTLDPSMGGAASMWGGPPTTPYYPGAATPTIPPTLLSPAATAASSYGVATPTMQYPMFQGPPLPQGVLWEYEDDGEEDPNPPLNVEQLNSELFQQEKELYLDQERWMWQPIISVTTQVNSKKIRSALDTFYTSATT